VEKVKIWIKSFRWGGLVFKILPIGISVLSLGLARVSFVSSQPLEKLSYEILTTNDYVDSIILDGEEIKATLPRIVRSRGSIDKTTLIFYHSGEYQKISEAPTNRLFEDVSWEKNKNSNRFVTSSGFTTLYSIYSDEENQIYYTYYFLLIEGMDNSKHLHLITHFVNKNENTALTKNYSERTILDPERNEEYTKYFEKAKRDFFLLKEDLTLMNLL